MANRRLEKLESAISALEAQRKAVLAKERTENRAQQVRRMILIGKVVLARCAQQNDEGLKSRAFVGRIVEQLTRPADKSAFDGLFEEFEQKRTDGEASLLSQLFPADQRASTSGDRR